MGRFGQPSDQLVEVVQHVASADGAGFVDAHLQRARRHSEAARDRERARNNAPVRRDPEQAKGAQVRESGAYPLPDRVALGPRAHRVTVKAISVDLSSAEVRADLVPTAGEAHARRDYLVMSFAAELRSRGLEVTSVIEG